MGDESHLTALRHETITIQTDAANIAREAAEMDRERARLALARERMLHVTCHCGACASATPLTGDPAATPGETGGGK